MIIMCKTFGLLTLLALVALALACSSFGNVKGDISNTAYSDEFETNVNRFDIAEFERNRELWTSKNIQHYRMIVGAEGFITNFPESVSVEVHLQKVKSIKSLSENGRDATETYKGFETIENLFRFVEEEIDRKAEKIEIDFHHDFGYPERILVDRSRAADDEILIKVEKLEIISR